MSILQPRRPRPTIGHWLVLYGDRGTGKTTLATHLRKGKAATLAFESVDIIYNQLQGAPDIFDAPAGEAELMALLSALESSDYETVIIDSISALDSWAADAILARHPKGQALGATLANVEGYYKAYNELEVIHKNVAASLRRMRAAGKRVIVIGHQAAEKVSPPDGDEYTRWALAAERVAHTRHYLIEADLVARLHGSIAVDKAGKATGGSVIAIDTRASAASECKSRIPGLDRQITWHNRAENPLAAWLNDAPPSLADLSADERARAIRALADGRSDAVRSHWLSRGFATAEIDEFFSANTAVAEAANTPQETP